MYKRQVQAPKTVLLDYRFNAMAASTFRFATFGAKSHVYFGVPLLQYLSPEEAECVLAHEVAHHIGRDVVIGAKESRLVQMWNQVLDKGRTGYSGAPMRPFFRWYMPRLEALSTVLKRENEHDADRLAASVMGVETSARSLMRIEVGASLWTKPFRDDYWKRSADLPEAPSEFLRSLESWPLPEPDKVAAAVMEACEATTGPYDSHPTLADRLTRIDRSLDPRSDDGRKRLVGLCREQPVERAMHAWFAPRSKAQFLKLFDIEIARAEDHDWNERRAVHLSLIHI